jgi:hypothetical protein
VEVFSRVLVGRRVAAADVAAAQTDAKVYPIRAARKTLFTAGGARLDITDLVYM